MPDKKQQPKKTSAGDWKTWWLRFTVEEARDRSRRLHETLSAQRGTTYMAIAVSGAIHTAMLLSGLLAGRPSTAVYAAGSAGVLSSVLYTHWPMSPGLGPLLARGLARISSTPGQGLRRFRPGNENRGFWERFSQERPVCGPDLGLRRAAG